MANVIDASYLNEDELSGKEILSACAADGRRAEVCNFLPRTSLRAGGEGFAVVFVGAAVADFDPVAARVAEEYRVVAFG